MEYYIVTFISNDDIVTQFDSTGGATDAFKRLRTSHPAVLFSDKSYINNTLLWATSTTGTGALDTSHALIDSTLDLTVGTDSGATSIRQTRQRHVYQPGKSQLILVTGVLEPKANVTSAFGYFDDKNGLYISATGTTISVNRRSNSSGSVVDTTIDQASWSLDPLDGTGPSGLTCDFSKAFILIIDFEWLGVGIARIGVVVDGDIIYTHAFKHANVLHTTYMGSGTLPVRYEIRNTGATASATKLRQICCSVISEGGQEEEGVVTVTDTGINDITIADNGLWNPVISFRLNPASLNANMEIITTEILSANKTDLSYRLIFNGTLTGASWTTNSSGLSQHDLAATSITGGEHFDGGYVESRTLSPTNVYSNKLRLGANVAGVPDTITLAVRPIGAAADIYAIARTLERY